MLTMIFTLVGRCLGAYGVVAVAVAVVLVVVVLVVVAVVVVVVVVVAVVVVAALVPVCLIVASFSKIVFPLQGTVSQYEKCPRSKMFKRHINVIWKKRPGTPKQPDLNGMFGETPVVYVMTWSHPTKTTILKVDVSGTRSIYYLYKTLLVNLPFFLVNIYHPTW